MEPWTKFRNLCHYYADCVKYSEKSQEYLFPNQLNKTFIIPRLPVNWYLKDEEFVVETAKEDAFVRAQLLKDSSCLLDIRLTRLSHLMGLNVCVR